MATVTERLQLLITASTKGAVAGIKETELAAGGLDQKAQGLTGVLQKMGLQGQVSGGIMAAGIAGGAALAAGALVKFGLDAVNTFANATSGVRAFQRASGATAEDSSRLVAAMQRLGIETDAGSTAFFQLAKRIGTGKDTLDQWGVAVAHNKDGNVDMARTIENMAEAYVNIQDPTARAAFLFENFGRQGATLIPLLSQGKQGLQEFYKIAAENHQIFSQEDLDKGRDFTRAQKDLNAALKGVEIEVGQALIPILTDLSHVLTDVVHAADRVGKALSAGGGSFLDGALGSIPIIGGAAVAARHLVGELGGVGGGSKSAAEGTARLVQKQEEAAAAADAQAKAEEHLQSVLLQVAGGQLGYEAAILGVDKAHRQVEQSALAVEQAQVSLDEAIKEHGKDSLEARQATLALADAQSGQKDAALGVQQANLAVAQAAISLFDSTNDLTLSTAENKKALDEQILKLQAVARQYPESAGQVQPYIDKLVDMRAKLDGTQGTWSASVTADTSDADRKLDGLLGKLRVWGASPFANFSGYQTDWRGDVLTDWQGNPIPRAKGGPAIAGMPYLVNENTPNSEIFVPSQSGYIVPNGGSMGAAGGGGWGGSITIQIPLNGRVIAEATVSEFNRAGGPKISQRAIAS